MAVCVQMWSLMNIGALIIAVAVPVAVGFIGTAVGGGGDSGELSYCFSMILSC